MKTFWKSFYVLGAGYFTATGFSYWFEAVPADNITLAIFSWVIAFAFLTSAITRE